MSVDDPLHDAGRRLSSLPSFDLTYGVDDRDHPTQVTVYSESVDEIESCWISIEAGYAIDLEDVA